MFELIDTSLDKQRLIADIGGTNARFALLNSNGSIQDEMVLPADNYPDFISAYNHYIALTNNSEITEAAIAIANPINGKTIKMTNHKWEFSIEDVRNELQLDTLIFKNDFEALALSIPLLDRSECYQVGGSKIKPKSSIGVLGPGTGLGVSGLLYSGDKWTPFSGEGGHASLSPTTMRECRVLDYWWQKFDHVSGERLVSGKGLQNILEALSFIEGIDINHGLSPQDISKKALEKTDELCEETLDIFCGLLGVVAGNLALTLGAKGGIYIGGGIVPKLGSFFENSAFRERFEAKGRLYDYLKDVPVFVIKTNNAALLGISQAFN